MQETHQSQKNQQENNNNIRSNYLYYKLHGM
jgi:hypothetical protein